MEMIKVVFSSRTLPLSHLIKQIIYPLQKGGEERERERKNRTCRQEISIENLGFLLHTQESDAIVYLNGEIRPRHWRLIAPIARENKFKTLLVGSCVCGTKKHNMADWLTRNTEYTMKKKCVHLPELKNLFSAWWIFNGTSTLYLRLRRKKKQQPRRVHNRGPDCFGR